MEFCLMQHTNRSYPRKRAPRAAGRAIGISPLDSRLRGNERKPADGAADTAQDEAQERRRQREEFERARADNERNPTAQRRHLFTAFKLWTICPDKRCMRA
jgi:hypothetical protein